MIRLSFLFFLTSLFSSYQDPELLHVWSQIGDINHPTLEEYQLLDNYLVHGSRPYLDALRLSDHVDFYRGRMKSIENFRLAGPTLPLFEHYAFNNVPHPPQGRCILLFSSSNGIYPAKARKLLAEIENSGYSGHVLLRIGGFPNTPHGGLKICHVPYAFKVAFLQEARQLGYKELLWIDLSVHPLSDFEIPFWEIEHTGHFFSAVGTLEQNRKSHLPKAAQALGITPDQYGQIPHISSAIIGLNMDHPKAVQLLESWYTHTENVVPSMTWWPEELSLSVAAWRIGCAPFCSLGELVCMESEQFQLENRPTVQFYLDGTR